MMFSDLSGMFAREIRAWHRHVCKHKGVLSICATLTDFATSIKTVGSNSTTKNATCQIIFIYLVI